MKLLGFIVLVFVLITSLFGIWGAKLTGNVLIVALMVLLITLFSDLEEFDFFGLKGKKREKEFIELSSKKPGIAESKVQKPNLEEVQKAQQQEKKEPIQLMDTVEGNFLKIAFEIERLLRIAATVISAQETPANLTPPKIVKILKEKGLLTESGEKQIEAIRWLRDLLAHGRGQEITPATIGAGITLGWNLYTELNNWLSNPN